MGESMRIQRALARAGVASRRHAEELVSAGRVTVNGQVATIGQSVDPDRDTIVVDGKPVGAPAKFDTWLVLNKPSGYLTSRGDPQGRQTVFDLVPVTPGLTYVGRLDYMTEGVLLFTTDGNAANKLTHPSMEVDRTYVATVRGDAEMAARMARKGIELEDGPVNPRDIDVRRLARGLFEFQLTISEGRTREVRRLCEALELTVERLVRVSFGPVKLGELEPGKTRALSAREKRVIDVLVGN
ncbi:MAG: pseudouridine synthase Rsu [Gemmatimonadetes bacterium]|nr:pseudouridine synthase Rsu [Gemmatimonadota bacterium]